MENKQYIMSWLTYDPVSANKITKAGMSHVKRIKKLVKKLSTI